MRGWKCMVSRRNLFAVGQKREEERDHKKFLGRVLQVFNL